jgi:hypothetical protein
VSAAGSLPLGIDAIDYVTRIGTLPHVRLICVAHWDNEGGLQLTRAVSNPGYALGHSNCRVIDTIDYVPENNPRCHADSAMSLFVPLNTYHLNFHQD